MLISSYALRPILFFRRTCGMIAQGSPKLKNITISFAAAACRAREEKRAARDLKKQEWDFRQSRQVMSARGDKKKQTLARPPPRQGLYDPAREHDSCGMGFVASIRNQPSHAIIADGLHILCHMEHRGGAGADPQMGDGAGILLQTPDAFCRKIAGEHGQDLPPAFAYACAPFFLPPERAAQKRIEKLAEKVLAQEGLKPLFWRAVPVDSSVLSAASRASEPCHKQVFIAAGANQDAEAFETRLFIARKRIGHALAAENLADAGYIASMSARTLVYKGMFLAPQLGGYYRDLADQNLVSALAMVHQRFSTNTFPSWPLAHPYRLICHNGEINTLRGNLNWMAARHASMRSPVLGEDIKKIWPVIREGQSDAASFDNALELLLRGGYSLAHAMMLMIPEAWAGNALMDEERRAFYEYHAALMEPWDGPAAIAFSDGRQIGAVLDRNGLRPARYVVTHDERIIMASETGVLEIDEENIAQKWRLQPGKMLLIDLEKGRIIDDGEIKRQLAAAHPYRKWLAKGQIILEDLPARSERAPRSNVSLLDRQQAFGWSEEDLKFLLAPMTETGQEAVGSMGTDTPLAVLSAREKLLYTYFKQNFAQVTNPAIDPIREDLVMSLVSFIGPRPSLFDLKGLGRRKRLEVRQPILRDSELEKIRTIGEIADNHFRARTLDISYNPARGRGKKDYALGWAIARLQAGALAAVREGDNIIILSDRHIGADRIAIPALLATSAVHHHLVRKGLRTSVGLVVETGEAREVHHMCCLAGYGAEAINPWLAFETIIAEYGEEGEKACRSYVKALNKGILKVMSKMGISTYQSYCGAQIFDAIGLAGDFLQKYFPGTNCMIEGAGLNEIAAEMMRRHRRAYGGAHILREDLSPGGEYAYRLRGEHHVWTPDAVRDLQHAVRGESQQAYDSFAARVNEMKNPIMLRSLMRLKPAAETGRTKLPLDAVEPAAAIVKRFSTGAMSYGSISREAHTTLALAMNRIGGKSNTGEGGEEADRYQPLANGDSMRSAIKQVASGRFGVTSEYLVNADMMQIKIAQGAKPGEGGQLPGHKVDPIIARVRYSTPGVGLISPPPHHDIYSIEDLAQLIFDLKNANPRALVSVKLVSEIGVGTVAAGVAKARADHVTIAGYDGGTGASPLTSIKHAGSPWEIGLAETHQTLVLNRLRGRISVQTDGGLRTGRDVVIAAALGADEFGFATAPLIASGCLMMRKCHLNTCPVGIATQDPVLRQRFRGLPEHVINYFFFVAQEARRALADMGFATINELIGQADCLDQRQAIDHWKSHGLDLTPLLHKIPSPPDVALFKCEDQQHPLATALDHDLLKAARPVLEKRARAAAYEGVISNINRTVGAMLSSEITRAFGAAGLPEDSLHIKLKGQAGQSFGAFLAPGVSLELAGETNDYTGKGLSGGRIVVYPPAGAAYKAHESIIVGNTTLYGATSGACYFAGVAGERFAVRNSGALAVVEGVGDHGCEYMTGGVVAVLGQTGRNFAAGMSGGIAYVYDEAGDFARRCNLAMVELEPVAAEEERMEAKLHQTGDLETPGRVDVMSDMTRFDAERLRQMIRDHVRYTGSKRGREILQNFDKALARFVKVMPVEYRRALAGRADAALQPGAAKT